MTHLGPVPKGPVKIRALKVNKFIKNGYSRKTNFRFSSFGKMQDKTEKGQSRFHTFAQQIPSENRLNQGNCVLQACEVRSQISYNDRNSKTPAEKSRVYKSLMDRLDFNSRYKTNLLSGSMARAEGTGSKEAKAEISEEFEKMIERKEKTFKKSNALEMCRKVSHSEHYESRFRVRGNAAGSRVSLPNYKAVGGEKFIQKSDIKSILEVDKKEIEKLRKAVPLKGNEKLKSRSAEEKEATGKIAEKNFSLRNMNLSPNRITNRRESVFVKKRTEGKEVNNIKRVKKEKSEPTSEKNDNTYMGSERIISQERNPFFQEYQGQIHQANQNAFTFGFLYDERLITKSEEKITPEQKATKSIPKAVRKDSGAHIDWRMPQDGQLNSMSRIPNRGSMSRIMNPESMSRILDPNSILPEHQKYVLPALKNLSFQKNRKDSRLVSISNLGSKRELKKGMHKFSIFENLPKSFRQFPDAEGKSNKQSFHFLQFSSKGQSNSSKSHNQDGLSK